MRDRWIVVPLAAAAVVGVAVVLRSRERTAVADSTPLPASTASAPQAQPVLEPPAAPAARETASENAPAGRTPLAARHEEGGKLLVRGTLALKGGGSPGKAAVALRTGDPEVDFPEQMGDPQQRKQFNKRFQHGFSHPGEWRPARRTEAAGDGSFAIEVPRGFPPFVFLVDAEFGVYTPDHAYQPESAELRSAVALLLEPAGVVEAVVTGAKGEPVPEAGVTFVDARGREYPALPERGWAGTGPGEGGVAVAVLMPGSYTLAFVADGFAPKRVSVQVGTESPQEVVARFERKSIPK